jgi:hypothetical protein
VQGRRRTRGPAREAPSLPPPSTPRNLLDSCRGANGAIWLTISVYPPVVSSVCIDISVYILTLKNRSYSQTSQSGSAGTVMVK